MIRGSWNLRRVLLRDRDGRLDEIWSKRQWMEKTHISSCWDCSINELHTLKSHHSRTNIRTPAVIQTYPCQTTYVAAMPGFPHLGGPRGAPGFSGQSEELNTTPCHRNKCRSSLKTFSEHQLIAWIKVYTTRRKQREVSTKHLAIGKTPRGSRQPPSETSLIHAENVLGQLFPIMNFMDYLEQWQSLGLPGHNPPESGAFPTAENSLMKGILMNKPSYTSTEDFFMGLENPFIVPIPSFPNRISAFFMAYVVFGLFLYILL